MVAAVALILHETKPGAPELLFIERATRETDPWSGQMAFPGGRHDPGDRDLEATAARETLEEVGVRLEAPIGRLDDVLGGQQPHRRLLVAPCVYALEERPELHANHEVRSAVWVPLSWILQPESAVQHRFERAPFSGSYPAFRYERYVIWGLTYRITACLLTVLGHPLPSHQSGERRDEQSG
ncbi:MAG: NUDIX hydrolase [Myxococcota bacterium]